MGKKSAYSDNDIRGAVRELNVDWSTDGLTTIHGSVRKQRKELKKLGLLG
jgi:hypothetical protein